MTPCPLCGLPFKQKATVVADCDHEADWYRAWLAIATDALEAIALGAPSAYTAREALRAIQRSVD